ncbi:MAG: hypothetical protein JNM16_09870, partial [Dechloromonas sp.]|nr:hypothetical protein [Dechloromonas sp.]
MKKFGMLSILVAMSLGITADADAKGRIRSAHASSGDAHAHHATETHISDSGTGSGAVRTTLARSGRSNDHSASGGNEATGSAASAEEDENLRRIRQE